MKTFVGEAFAEEVAFLKAIVRVPSDNPPGDCDPHAAAGGDLLEAMGSRWSGILCRSPRVRQHGMKSATNLIVRHVFGAGKGPVIALNAHGDVVPPGDGWTADPYGAEERNGAILRPRRSRSRSRTSRPMPSP